MSLLKTWKIVVALLGIFGAGAYTGHLVTVNSARPGDERRASVKEYTHQTKERLRSELRLRPEQMARIEEIVDEAGRSLDREYSDSLDRILKILDRVDERIRPELDEDQSARYDELVARARERIQRRMAGGESVR